MKYEHKNLLSEKISKEVENLYNFYPYPGYPLLASSQWLRAYTASPNFIRGLSFGAHGIENNHDLPLHILIAGSGDSSPLSMSPWLNKRDKLTCVDISQRSISRLRWRYLFHPWYKTCQTNLYHQDMYVFLSQCISEGIRFNHIECYGVLHHLANPSEAISLLSQCLFPMGTMRIMVYNSRARFWLGQISKVFSQLKIKMDNESDMQLCYQILMKLQNIFPSYYGKRIRLTNFSAKRYLADTLIHPRVINWSYTQWLEVFARNQMQLKGLFDRYGELDDLPNPLWQKPEIELMENRVEDFRFENNFEWYFAKQQSSSESVKSEPNQAQRQSHQTRSLFSWWKKIYSYSLTHYPDNWFDFQETKTLSNLEKKSLWHNYLSHHHYISQTPREKAVFQSIIDTLPLKTKQRLARIGALLPKMNIQGNLLAPMEETMEAPNYNESKNSLAKGQKILTDYFSQILSERDLFSPKRLAFIVKRMSPPKTFVD